VGEDAEIEGLDIEDDKDVRGVLEEEGEQEEGDNI
jgi:hypothetical protein